MITNIWFVRPGPFLDARYGDIGGQWNGYVVVHKSHPWFGDLKSNIPILVHGGITFSSNCKGLDWEEVRDYRDGNWWVYGFDTFHFGDSLLKWPRGEVERETCRMAEQFYTKSIIEERHDNNRIVRDEELRQLRCQEELHNCAQDSPVV